VGHHLGWATERGELNVAERRDAPILFEASLGLDQLPQYHWRLRNVIKSEFGK